MRALILLVLLAPITAHADAIARNGSDWVRLTLKACQDPKITAALTAQGKHPDAYRAALAHVGASGSR